MSVDEAVSAPADAVAEELLQGLRSELGAEVLGAVEQRGELYVRIRPLAGGTRPSSPSASWG